MSNDLIRFEPVQRLRFLSFFRITSSLLSPFHKPSIPLIQFFTCALHLLIQKSNKVRYNAARSVMVSSDVKAWWSRSNSPEKGGGLRTIAVKQIGACTPRATRQHSSWTCTGEGPTLRRAKSPQASRQAVHTHTLAAVADRADLEHYGRVPGFDS